MTKVVNIDKNREDSDMENGLDPVEDFMKLLSRVLHGDKDAAVEMSFILYLAHKMANETDLIDELIPDEYFDPDEEDVESDDQEEDSPDFNDKITLPREDVKEYHIRIKLNHVEQKIWREVKVPSNLTLEALAHVLLESMGWEMRHLYCFRIKDQTYASQQEIEEAFYGQMLDYSQYTISDVLDEKSGRMKLEYDYGDSWSHDVWVKGIRDYNEGEKPAIVLVKGVGACPPEDCGGFIGYEELLRLREKKRLSKADRERLVWNRMSQDDGFDPTFFNHELAEEQLEYWNELLQNEKN